MNLAQAAQAVETAAQALVNPALAQFYALYPWLRAQHGEAGIEKCRQDCHYHLEFLVAALRNNDPRCFTEYIRWVRVVLRARGRNTGEGLAQMLEIIGQQIRAQLGQLVWEYVQPIWDAGLAALQEEGEGHALHTLPPLGVLVRRYLQALLKGDRLAAQQMVMDAFNAGTSLRSLYLDVFQPALYEIGRLWETGRVSVAQEHLATAITQSILSTVYAQAPLQANRGGEQAIVACLEGNWHQIGPRMIADFLQMAGFDTRFLGANTSTDTLLTMIQEMRPAVVGLPSTFPSQIAGVRAAIEQIRADFTTQRPIIMVGGLAFNFNEGLWKQVGGDVWGRDAGQAVDHLLGKG